MGLRGGRVSEDDRKECLKLITEAVQSGARKFMACDILEVKIRTVERWELNLIDGRCGPINKPFNAFSDEERSKILTIVNSSEFANLPPCQIVPKLADQGKYLASESSIYRILKANKMLVHRSKSRAKVHKKPAELMATKPNQIWSWDITYLKSKIKGIYYYLYLPMDIFSRKIVHYEVHEEENSTLSSAMINKAFFLNQIKKHELVLHSDNGGAMKGATMLATLEKLGVAASFSRPRVSDDNPFSESLFKTLKYCPAYPEFGFNSLEEARTWVEKFVEWYNNIHLHSGINFVTPSSRHDGKDQEILLKRVEVYKIAQAKNPDRWSKNTRNWSMIQEVKLNPGKLKKVTDIKFAA